jgi:glycerophosphoryl diester phosphodiesterase
MHAALRGLALIATAGVLAALASCGGAGTAPPTDTNLLGSHTGSAAPVYDLGPDGRTTKPAQCVALSGSGYEELPLVTVGDEIPLLTGDYPHFGTSDSATYALPGIPDGLGLQKKGNSYFVWMNSEFGATAVSRWSDTVTGTLRGARVSLLEFDLDWRCLGGTNLVRRFIDSTGVIGEVTFDGSSVTHTGFAANRFCSSTLTEFFGNGDPIFLTGEETSNGLPFAVYTNGDAVVINDLPRFGYENIVPVTRYHKRTVLLAQDDTANAFLVLYTGNRGSSDPNGLLSGTSYVAAVKAGGALQANTGALLPGTDYELNWVEIPHSFGSGDPYESQSLLYSFAGTVATRFMRPEDAHEDPNSPGSLYFDTTGSTGSYDSFGRTWRLNLHTSNPTGKASLRVLTIGGANVFYNPDNVCVDTYGKFWIQEDPSGTAGLMLAENRRSSIFTTDLLGGGLTRLFEVTQPNAPFASNPWETSGIVQVETGWKWGGRAAVLFDTQAHGVADPSYVESGQLILGVPEREQPGLGYPSGWFN